MKEGICVNTVSLSDLKKHFEFVSKDFVNQINLKVSLDEYLNKIYDNATLYEYWIGNVLVGLAAVYKNKGKENPAYLTNLSVVEERTGKGFATKLLDFIIEDLKKNGFFSFLLEVKKDNAIAFNLYKKKGFSITTEKTAESWLMQLSLSNNEDVKIL